MAFVLNFAKTIRNHWKKSCVLVAVSVYGVKYARDKHGDEQIRRVYCEEAKQYGYQSVTLTQRPKKIYVFLNPAAQGNNSKKLFEKNAAPLLHLAGFEVVLVKTEYESQAKEFMSVIEVEDVHSVIVAGGDGTLSEVVSGILKKGNRHFERRVPIGIIPLGNTNRFARKLFGYGKEILSEVQAIVDTAMAVIRGKTKKVDILSIKGDDDKTTFALSGLEVGAFRDAVARRNKYWYFGPLKFRWTYIRTIMKDWPPAVKGQLTFVPSDAVVCRQNDDKSADSTPAEKWSWWNLFFRTRKISKEAEDVDEDVGLDFSDSEETRDISTVELTLMSGLYNDSEDQATVGKHMVLGIGPSSPTRTELLQEGWRRINEDTLQLGTKSNETVTARLVKFKPVLQEDEQLWFTIDGEHYEAKPVEIRLLKNRLSFYCVDETI